MDIVIIWLIWPELTKPKITPYNLDLLIAVILLVFSVSLCPKVITLSGFNCTTQ